MPRPMGTVRARRIPRPQATSHIGSSSRSSDWRMPAASARYAAASQASPSLPSSARKAKYATPEAKSASPAYVSPTEP